MPRRGMERKHSRAFPERAGRDGQQQLPGELWRRRERGQGGVRPRGTPTLQVQACQAENSV